MSVNFSVCLVLCNEQCLYCEHRNLHTDTDTYIQGNYASLIVLSNYHIVNGSSV